MGSAAFQFAASAPPPRTETTSCRRARVCRHLRRLINAIAADWCQAVWGNDGARCVGPQLPTQQTDTIVQSGGDSRTMLLIPAHPNLELAASARGGAKSGLALLLTPRGRAGREAREIKGHGGVHQLASLDVAREGFDWIAGDRDIPPLQLVGIVGEGQRKGRLRPPPGGGVGVEVARRRHVAVLVIGRIRVPHPLLNAPPILVSPELVQARSRGRRRSRLPSGLDLDDNLMVWVPLAPFRDNSG